MKKHLFLIISFAVITLTTKAQTIEDFYMPQIRSVEQAAQYVGQTVIVYDLSAMDPKWDDVYKYEKYFKGILDCEYCITKVKYGSQIVFSLQSKKDGTTIKVPINIDGADNFKGLSSNNIFFLLDKFNTQKDKLIGKKIKNINGEEVAVIDDVEIYKHSTDSPIIFYNISSLLSNDKFFCKPEEVDLYTKMLGITLTNPTVKYSYRITSLSNYMPIGDKHIYSLMYVCQNTTTGETKNTSTESVETSVFADDLSGKYVSLLSNVEKPSNPEIRYGETTTIPSDDALSKFSYKDNVIDIIILADNDSFNFVLQNISGSTIKIVWDEAVFVNFDGSTEKVMHKGTKYAERNESQPATTIIRNAKWEDTVIPNHLVYYRDGGDYFESGWETHSMYPSEKGLSSGQVMLMLPIQIKDVINEYIFIFDVKYIYNHPERINIATE